MTGAAPEDSGYAPETWAFDDEVTRVFDDMLRRSIPQYELMRELVFELGCGLLGREEGTVIDIGASRGEALAPFIKRYGATLHHVAAEVSPPMLEVLRARFAGMIDAGVVEVLEHDLREGFPPRRAKLVLSVLTLMFVPIEHRQRLVHEAYEAIVAPGAMIVVEKILGESAPINEIFADRYREEKKRNGYSEEEIDRKALALEGQLVPVTSDWNEELLRRAGFDQVDCFWRWCNFAGWIAVKSR